MYPVKSMADCRLIMLWVNFTIDQDDGVCADVFDTAEMTERPYTADIESSR